MASNINTQQDSSKRSLPVPVSSALCIKKKINSRQPIMNDEKDNATNQESATSNTLYQTASQHWIHAEQVRWTLLNNFLMAATILLLAWAAVYAGGSGTVITRKLTLNTRARSR